MKQGIGQIILVQLAVRVFASAPSVSAFQSFWGPTIKHFTGSTTGMGTSSFNKEVAVSFPSRAARNFTMTVDANNPTKATCDSLSRSYTCGSYSGSALSPGNVFESTFMTQQIPTITWANETGVKYTVLLYDANLKICHWVCMNVEAGTLAGARGCYNLFAVPSDGMASSFELSWFPPGAPSTMALPYGFLLFQQAADITESPASILAHGKNASMMGTGNMNFSFPDFATNQSLTLKGSNWFKVKGNAYSAFMFTDWNGGQFKMFSANAQMYNCSTMDDSHCTYTLPTPSPTPPPTPTPTPPKGSADGSVHGSCVALCSLVFVLCRLVEL